MIQMNTAYKPLSTRELQVAELTLKGFSYTEIGEELELSPNTIKAYRKSLYSKLDINSKRQLFALKLLERQNETMTSGAIK